MVQHGLIPMQTIATRYVDHTERLITTLLTALSTGNKKKYSEEEIKVVKFPF